MTGIRILLLLQLLEQGLTEWLSFTRIEVFDALLSGNIPFPSSVYVCLCV